MLVTARALHGCAQKRQPDGRDHVVAIENLSLTVRRGEFVSLLGPSGCGKSTLLKAIARLVPPARGKIVLRDAHLRERADFFDAAQHPTMTFVLRDVEAIIAQAVRQQYERMP